MYVLNCSNIKLAALKFAVLCGRIARIGLRLALHCVCVAIFHRNRPKQFPFRPRKSRSKNRIRTPWQRQRLPRSASQFII